MGEYFAQSSASPREGVEIKKILGGYPSQVFTLAHVWKRLKTKAVMNLATHFDKSSKGGHSGPFISKTCWKPQIGDK